MNAGCARVWGLAAALALAPMLAAQQGAQPQSTGGPGEGPMTENPRYKQKAPEGSAPPRSDAAPLPSTGESSSAQTRIDVSPPKADELAHPDSGRVGDVTGMHEWNPMRAMKDVEVGDYYYKAGNYKAAQSRFREALLYKPRDAVATFKLAQTLEKNKQFEEARAQYEAYLEILKDGPSAGEARKALERLKKQ
jgi:tetratricopeptide (TPR) repeat protein